MKVIFVILALVGLSHAAVTAKDQLAKLVAGQIDEESLRQARADASDYLDQVLANVRELLVVAGLQIIPLPNATMSFEQEIGGVVWHGEAALHNGTLANMETIHRTGAADLTIEENGDTVVSAEVGVNRGTLHYDMFVTFMDLGPHATVNGTLSEVRALFALRITKDMNITLDVFDVKSTGLLTIDVKGLGAILNFLTELLVDFVGNVVKGIVVLFLEGTIKDVINDIISSILFPPEIFTAIKAVQNVVSAAY